MLKVAFYFYFFFFLCVLFCKLSKNSKLKMWFCVVSLFFFEMSCLFVFVCLWRLSAPPFGRVYAVETLVALNP